MYQHILIAVDLSAESSHVIERGKALAERTGARLSLLHAMEPFSFAYGGEIPIDLSMIQGQLNDHSQQRLQKLGEQLGIEAQDQHIVLGRPETEIHRKAAEIAADLIVVGSHGRHGFSMLFGSTTDDVVHRAHCDVLTVHVESSH